MLNCGDTFYAGDTEDDEPHLWIIISPPTDDKVVIVSVTTRRLRSETLVCLKVGDHPFIKHESVIAFTYSQIRCLADINSAIQNGNAKQREAVAPELLKRIRMGLVESDRTPNGIRYFYQGLDIKE